MARGLGEAIILNISIKGGQLFKGGDLSRDGYYSKKIYSIHSLPCKNWIWSQLSHNTEIIYIDLARAKSEALINIYSLLKQNIKSCNAEWRWQQKGPKKSVGLISTKTTLHMQHTFIVHFIAIVLHNYNPKLPDTSLLHVLPRKSFLYSCSLVSLLLIFTLVFASISHFLTAAKKFSCFSFNKIGLLCFLSLTLALSLLSTSM